MKRNAHILVHKASSLLLSILMLLSNMAPAVAYAIEDRAKYSEDEYFEYELTKEGYKIKGLKDKSKYFLEENDFTLTIPESHNDIPVIGLGKNSLQNKKIKKLNLPNTIKEIDDFAIYKDEKGDGLEEINIYPEQKDEETGEVIKQKINIERIGEKAIENQDLKDLPFNVRVLEESSLKNNNFTKLDLTDTETIRKDSLTQEGELNLIVNKYSDIEQPFYNEEKTKVEYIEKEFNKKETDNTGIDYLAVRQRALSETFNNKKEEESSEDEDDDSDRGLPKFVEPEELNKKEFEDLKEKSITPKRLSFLDYFVKTVHASETAKSEADGSKIETISSKWVDTNESHQTLKWDDDEEKLVKLRTSYSLSGQHDYDPGTIQISIPKNIFKDRSGKYTGYMTLGVPALPGGSTEFAYYDAGDKYILINTKVIKAASQGMFEATFRSLIPHTIVDKSAKYKTDEYKAIISITTRNNNVISMKSNSLTADVDTKNKMTYANIEGDVVYEGWPSSWDRSLIPEDMKNPEDYIYTTWRTYGKNVGNQTFKIDFEDSVNNGGYTTNGRVVAIRRNIDMSFHKSDNIKGFFPEDGEYGYNSSDKSYFTDILTAYPKSDFFNKDGTSKEAYFDLTNKIKYTLTSEDDKEITSKEATSTIRYVPVLPTLPTGHFIVRKCPGTPTYFPERHCEPVDSYPIHLNNIINNKEAEVIYRIRPQAFGLPWTSEDDIVEKGKVVDFNKYEKVPYEIEIRDNKVKFNGEDELLEKGDYEFSKIKFNKPDIYSYKKANKDIYSYYENASGVVAYGKVPEGRYAYIKEDANIDFEVFVAFEKDGSFEKVATVNNSNGKISIDPINGASVNKDELILPKGVVDYKVISRTSKAAVIWDMDVSVKLLPSDKIKNKVEAMFKETGSPKTYLYNAADMNVRLKGSKENTFINEDGGQNTLEGFAYGVNTTKTLRYENQPSLRNVKLHYKAETEIQTNLIKEGDLKESIEKGYFKEEKVATWYDLLPKGVIPDTSTISVRKKDEVLDIEVINNYKNSGRTLLKVIVKQTPDYKLKENNPDKNITTIIGQDGLVDTPILEFDANYSWESISDLGKNLRNQIVYESHNDYLGNYKGLTGEKDNPTGKNHSNTRKAVRDDVKEILTDLNKDNDNPSFIYGVSDVEVNVDKSTVTNLTKYVDTEGKGIYTDGLDEINSGNVYENQTYNYRLRIQNPIGVKANNIVLYDKLEGYNPTMDKLDHGDKQWQGTLMSIDTSQLESMGIKPVVYYSVKKDIVLDNTKDRSHNNLSNKEIWTTNKPENPREITAIAIDASKDKNGNNFVLEPNKSLSVIVNMKAPDLKDMGYIKSDKEKRHWYDTQREVESVNRRIVKVGNQEYVYTNNIYSTEEGLNGGAHAYNNVVTILNSMSADDISKKEELLIRHDYTKVGLKPYNIDVEKVFNDDKDRDGKRPKQVQINLLADGKVVKTTVLNEDNKWKGRFEFLPYLNSDGKEIKYTFEEKGSEDYKLSIKEEYTEADVRKVVLENYYEPIRVNIPVRKTWENVQEYPESITYILKADGKEVNRVTVKPDANGSWDYTFKNLYKYRDGGKEIIYTLDELDVEDYVKTIDGSNITNEYKPYGDLKISKKLANASNKASKENEFSFTLYIEAVNNKDENRKVGNYKYEKSNGDSGLITNGSTFTLKGGENILIKDINSRFKYKVVENKIDYFKANQESIEGVIKSSHKAEEAVFINDYHTKGEIKLDVKKDLDGRKLRASQFRFNVYDEKGELVSVGFNDVNGNVVFNPIPVDNNDLGFSDNGLNTTHKKFYTIKEVNREEKGYEYDPKTVTAEVSLTDDGYGKIDTKIRYKDDKILDFRENTFSYNNKYKASGDVKVKAWKYVKFNKDNDYSGYKFKLSLKDILDKETGKRFDETNINKNKINYSLNKTFNNLEAVSDKEGNINFPDIKFNQYDAGKTFVFDVSEIDKENENLIYDLNTIKYYITVNDNGYGKLSFESDYSFVADETIGLDDYKIYAKDILKAFNDETNLDEVKTKDEVSKIINKSMGKYPLFINKFKHGSLKVSKNVLEGDKNKYFKFKIKLKNKDGDIPDGSFNLKTPLKYTPVEWEYFPERKELVLRPSGDGDVGYFDDSTAEHFLNAIVDPNSPYVKEENLNLGQNDSLVVEKKVEIDPDFSFGNTNIGTMDLTNLDLKRKDVPYYLFAGSSVRRIIGLNLQGRTDLRYMFTGYQGKELILENVKLNKNSNAENMFSNSKVEKISGLDTKKIINMSNMFTESQATSLDLSSFDTSNVTNMSGMFNFSQATRLDLSSFNTSNVTKMNHMFYGSKATSIDLSSFDTSKVTNMRNMFTESQATSLDLSSFDTSNVTNMSGMFAGSQVTNINLSSFNTSNVTDMSNMFVGSQVTNINLSSFDTSNVTNMSDMFRNSKATSLDVSKFDTSKVTNMSYMFSSSDATSLDLSSFDTRNVTNMRSMFDNSQAKSLDVSKFNTSKVTDMSYMFSNSKATTLDLSSFNISKVTDMKEMFRYSQTDTIYVASQEQKDRYIKDGSLSRSKNIIIKPKTSAQNNILNNIEKYIIPTAYAAGEDHGKVIHSGTQGGVTWEIFDDGHLLFRPTNGVSGTFDDMTFYNDDSTKPWLKYNDKIKSISFNKGVKGGKSISNMFYGIQVKKLDLSNFDTSNVTNMIQMFSNSQVTNLDLSSFDTSNVTDMSHMFRESKIANLDLSNFNTSNVTNMSHMFFYSQATNLDLSSFDTSNVTNMSAMFCYSQATNLDLSSFDTSNVTNMNNMFSQSQATSLDLSNFDTSNVTRMMSMFHNSQATNLDLSNFNTSNVTSMEGMFGGSQATSLDLSNFDTSNVTNMCQMFMDFQVTSLDLSNFDTSNVTNMYGMFNSAKIANLDLSNFDTSNVTNMGYMFNYSQIQKIKTSSKMKITSDMKFSSARADYENTGKWIREDKSFGPYTEEEMVTKYDPKTEYGTWVAEKIPIEYNVNFDKNNDKAIGNMKLIIAEKNKDILMPDSSYIAKNQRVIGYSKDPKAKVPEYKIEQSYKNIGNVGETVTLYAIWEDINTNLAFKNGELEFYLKDGDSVIFDSLPANTEYEIYEQSENGWILIQTVNNRGRIEANQETEALFYNQYLLNVAYPIIRGQKLIDDENIETEGYEFIAKISHNGKDLDSLEMVSDENGKFEFPLELAETGKYILEIEEKSSSTALIKKDDSKKIVTIDVTDNGRGELKAEVKYPNNDDKVVFNNTKNTANLKINKVVEGTDRKDQEFEVKVNLSNEVKPRIVKIKYNNNTNNYEGIVENLLPGVTYSIEEMNIPEGYHLKGYQNQTGTIEIGKENIATVINTYSSEGSFSINLKKTLEGRDLKDKEFKFIVKDEKRNKVAESYNRIDGTIQDFGAIKINTPGQHKFTVKEVKGNDNSIEYDDKVVTVTVNADDDGKGNLIIDKPVYSDTTFINKLKSGSLTIKKEVKGIINNQKFTFKVILLDKDNKPITGVKYKTTLDDEERLLTDTLTIQANEVVTITNLPEGSKYKIEEINIPKNYSIESQENTEGEIKSTKVSNALITNIYKEKQEPNTYVIKGKKILEGRDLKNKEFTFLLLDRDNKLLGKAQNNEDGTFSFAPIKLTKDNIGTNIYKVIEQKDDEQNVIYDMSEYTIKLNVIEENGNIKVDKETITNKGKRATSLKFTNVYDKNTTKFVIRKTLKGVKKDDTEFNIKVSIKKPNEEATTRVVQLRKDEQVDFEGLPEGTEVEVEEFAIPADYEKLKYKINGIETNKAVTKTKKGKETNIEVVNRKIPKGNLRLEAKKTLDGKIPEKDKFEFELLDANEKRVGTTVKNDENGNVIFNVSFTEKDLDKSDYSKSVEKILYMKEIKGNDDSIKYDDSKYMIKFNIRKTEDSDIVVEGKTITKDGKIVNDIIFKNETLLPPPTGFNDNGSKYLVLLMITLGLSFILKKKKSKEFV